MANTTNLNIHVDEELKRNAETVFSELGLNLSTAINIFLHYAVRYGGIPFDLRIEKPNAETLAAINDVNNDHNMSDVFDNISDLMQELNA